VRCKQGAFAEQWHSQLAEVLAKQLPLLRAWASEQVGFRTLWPPGTSSSRSATVQFAIQWSSCLCNRRSSDSSAA